MVSMDGVAPSGMVCVSASVNLPLHHNVQKFSSGIGSPGWSRKRGRKTVVVVVAYALFNFFVDFCQRAEMRMVRWMCNVKTKDRASSRELRERLGIDDIILILQQNRL